MKNNTSKGCMCGLNGSVHRFIRKTVNHTDKSPLFIQHSQESKSLFIALIIIYQITQSAFVTEGTTCDFLSQSAEDAHDWLIHTDATQTSNTGPNSAYDGKYYAYIEASHMDPETSAILEWSPPFMNGEIFLPQK